MNVHEYRRVAVIGPGEALGEARKFVKAQKDAERHAERVGVLLAGYQDVVTITGGLEGVMRAASRGAAEAGGLTLGFLPGDDPDQANPWVQIRIPTGLGEARNALVVACAEAVISVGGSWGTLSEIGLACRRGVPVAIVRGWRISGTPAAPLEKAPLPKECADADEAVAWVRKTLDLQLSAP